jgi:hypothetical protein
MCAEAITTSTFGSMRKALGAAATAAGALAFAAVGYTVAWLIGLEPLRRAHGAKQMLDNIKQWPDLPTSWCIVHRQHEPALGAYTDCGECGHVYMTYQDLKTAHAAVYAELGGGAQIGMITYCPLCLHDFC